MSKKSKNPATKSSPTKMQRIAAEIELCRDSSGRVQPKTYWKRAKENPDWISHGEFDWNVQSAAEKHWTRTAQELIRKVPAMIEYGTSKIMIPKWLSEPTKDGESSYSPTLKIAKSPVRSKRALQAEADRIKAQIHRAIKLATVFGLAASFERMLDEIIRVEIHLNDLEDGDEEGASA